MQINSESLVFPVLTVSRRGDLEVVENAPTLETTNALAIRQGYYDDMTVIDSRGGTYRVSDFERVAPLGPLWGVRFLKPRRLRVSLLLDATGPANLDEVKNRVDEAIRRRPEPWEALGEPSDIAQRIRSCHSVADVIRALR